jgi:hypothetical protein
VLLLQLGLGRCAVLLCGTQFVKKMNSSSTRHFSAQALLLQLNYGVLLNVSRIRSNSKLLWQKTFDITASNILILRVFYYYEVCVLHRNIMGVWFTVIP